MIHRTLEGIDHLAHVADPPLDDGPIPQRADGIALDLMAGPDPFEFDELDGGRGDIDPDKPFTGCPDSHLDHAPD